MQIRVYRPRYKNQLFEALTLDPDWEEFTTPPMVATYTLALEKSVTYVSFIEETLTGYIRAYNDNNLALYISELYVLPAYRNRGIGQSLLETIKSAYQDLTVYTLSDEDGYYEKKGFKRIGSVFE